MESACIAVDVASSILQTTKKPAWGVSTVAFSEAVESVFSTYTSFFFVPVR